MQLFDIHHQLVHFQPPEVEQSIDPKGRRYRVHEVLIQILAHLILNSTVHSHQLHPQRYLFYFQLKLLSFHSCEASQLMIDLHQVRQLERQPQT